MGTVTLDSRSDLGYIGPWDRNPSCQGPPAPKEQCSILEHLGQAGIGNFSGLRSGGKEAGADPTSAILDLSTWKKIQRRLTIIFFLDPETSIQNPPAQAEHESYASRNATSF